MSLARIRLVLWLPIVLALVLYLRLADVPWRGVGAWYLFSCALILGLEAVSYQKFLNKQTIRIRAADLRGNEYVTQKEHIKAELEGLSLETGELPWASAEWLVAVALLSASAFGLVLSVRRTIAPPDHDQVVVQFSDGAEKKTGDHSGPTPPAGPNSGPTDVRVHFSDALEKKLADYFASPLRFDGGTRLGFWGLAILLAFIAVLVWLFKDPRKAAPLVGASGFATAVLSKADHLSRPVGVYFWAAVYVLLGFGGSALIIGAFRLLREPAAAGETNGGDQLKSSPFQTGEGWEWLRRILKSLKGHPEPTKKESSLTVGLSVLILAWSLIILAKEPETNPGCKPCADSHSPSSAAIGTPRLLTGPTFEPNNSTKPKWRGADVNVVESLREQVNEGDVLLLVGSADCTRREGGNSALAFKRASTLADELLKEPGIKGRVEVLPEKFLPQYDRCTADENLRTVFPFLIPLTPSAK